MATPPKTPPAKAAPRKPVAPVDRPAAAKAVLPEAPVPAKPIVAKAPVKVATRVAPSKPVAAPAVPAPVAASKPMPFVIEPAPAPVTPELPAAAPVAAAKTDETPEPLRPVGVQAEAASFEHTAPWQTPPALEGNIIMNEAIETTKKFAEDAKVRVQSMMADFNDKAKVHVEKSSKTIEEINDIVKGNLEALVESSKIAAKGVETLGQSAAEYGRASFEKTSTTLRSFASVKSPTEFFQLHSDLMAATFDSLASETAKNSEAFLKLAGEIAQPLSSRVAVVSDKMKAIAA